MSKTKKIKYVDFLTLSKYILTKICEDKEYYGINLYRFEKSLRLYGTIYEVKQLLSCCNKERESNIMENVFYLKDIHFPKLYQGFSFIENFDNFVNCVQAFYPFMEAVVCLSRLVLDELVEMGCFGDGDKWYYFFLEKINIMSETVFYNPKEIDYSITPESQSKFEQVLSAPVRILFPQDWERIINNKSVKVNPKNTKNKKRI